MEVDVINFSQHPFRDESRETIRRLTGCSSVKSLDVTLQIDENEPLAGQVVKALECLDGLSLEELTLVIVLPGLSTAAACLLAELHGRLGHFPAVARLQRKQGPVVVYEVAGIIDLQSVRQEARTKRRA